MKPSTRAQYMVFCNCIYRYNQSGGLHRTGAKNTFFKTIQRPRFLKQGAFYHHHHHQYNQKRVSSLELDNGTLSFCSVIVLKSHPFHHKPWNDHHHHQKEQSLLPTMWFFLNTIQINSRWRTEKCPSAQCVLCKVRCHVSFMAQVLDTVTYFVSQVLDTAS